jgi:sec-independent protein translocase protein TatB
MFDFGFSEMLLVAVVALIVVGPQRLPKVARTAGHLLGRLQRYVAEVKSDVSREMQLEELKKLQQQVQEQARELETSDRKRRRAQRRSGRTRLATDESAVARSGDRRAGATV